MTEREKIKYARKMIKEHFNGSPVKTDLWFRLENPMLGGKSPNDFIRIGRIDKLLLFIESAIDENKRPDDEKRKQKKTD